MVGKNNAHNKSSWKIYRTETSKIVSTGIAYHDDSFILSNNSASTSSAISSILLVMVVATLSSPKGSRQMSFVAAESFLPQ